jgi:hypothetical protein
MRVAAQRDVFTDPSGKRGLFALRYYGNLARQIGVRKGVDVAAVYGDRSASDLCTPQQGANDRALP